MSALTVIKIGGSLAGSGRIATLLRGLAAPGRDRLIIVPGGGRFADVVREAQRCEPFDDRAAHEMALIAMHTSAVMFAALADGYAVAETHAAFAESWARGLTPIWAPERMALAAPDLSASWDVTSDSLSAWLAREMGATRLVLVKAVSVPEAIRSDADALARAGIVDPCFPRMVTDAGFEWRIAGDAERVLPE